jgi:hypothetical protein
MLARTASTSTLVVGIDGRLAQLDAEQVAGLVERRVRRLGLDEVGW